MQHTVGIIALSQHDLRLNRQMISNK